MREVEFAQPERSEGQSAALLAARLIVAQEVSPGFRTNNSLTELPQADVERSDRTKFIAVETDLGGDLVSKDKGILSTSAKTYSVAARIRAPSGVPTDTLLCWWGGDPMPAAAMYGLHSPYWKGKKEAKGQLLSIHNRRTAFSKTFRQIGT